MNLVSSRGVRTQAKPIGFGRLLGLCPLHADHKPSFLVDPHKNLFYCYGCRRGGDVIRFAELYHQVKFPQAVALLHQNPGPAVTGPLQGDPLDGRTARLTAEPA